MTDDVVQLAPADFEEALEHLNRAFGFPVGAGDFLSILPKLYQPERMSWNYAVKTDAGIRAMAGVYPMTLKVGAKTLKVAGIGGVSTHPDARGKGLMNRLMSHCMEVMKDADYDLSCLGGLRHRYGKFGYEVGGLQYQFEFLRQNLWQVPAKGLRLTPLGDVDDESISFSHALYERSAVHVIRPEPEFRCICRTWENRPFAAFDEQDRPAGYLVADRQKNMIVELCAESPGTAMRMIRAWMDQGDDENVFVQVKPSDLDLVRQLGETAQSLQAEQSYQWKVLHWSRTVDAFLNLQSSSDPQEDGSLVLSLDDLPNLKLTSTHGSGTCEETDEPPDLACTERQAVRMIFGPQSPAAVMPVPSDARMLESWCPLPLGWSSVDGV